MAVLFSQTIILGVGLLGGSLGLAAKSAHVGGRVTGLGRNPNKLKKAAELGAVDDWALTWDDVFANQRVSNGELPIQIIFAAPVEINLKLLEEFWSHRDERWFRERTFVISDVGSVKGDFTRASYKLWSSVAESDQRNVFFVPAHPIAGSDKSGVEHSSVGLFHGKLTVLTPWLLAEDRLADVSAGNATSFEPDFDRDDPNFASLRHKIDLALGGEQSSRDPAAVNWTSVCMAGPMYDAVSRVRNFWQALGSLVVETSAEEHDQILARTSHLTNLVSVLEMSVVPIQEFLFAGTGFQDITRLAGGSPDVWAEIYVTNRNAVLEALERLEENIHRWKTFLKEGDRESILTFLHETKKKRDALGS